MGNIYTQRQGNRARLVRIGALAGVFMLCAACATPEQRAARKQAEMAQAMAVYGPACSQLGYAANSDQWRACVLHLDTRAEMERFNNTPSFYGGFGPGYRRWGGYWGPYW